MCIMEVREGQHSSTIAQACAHNVSTVERDLDMFEPLLRARIDHARHHGTHAEIEREAGVLASVLRAHDSLKHAYATLLEVYGEEVSGELASHAHDAGNERSLIAQAHHDAQLARRYETR